MAVILPTVQEEFDRILGQLESALAVDSPLNDKAFLRVLASALALGNQQLYKAGTQGIKAVLASTAETLDDLKKIGDEYGVTYKQASNAVVVVQVSLVPGYTLTQGSSMISASTGLRYYTTQDHATPGIGLVTARCEVAGAAGNPTIDSIMTFEATGGPSIGSVYTDQSTGTPGDDAQPLESYRTQVLDVIQTVGGGGNYADYRNWAQEANGVRRAYPYSGNQEGETSYPGDITVYIEAETSIDADGIPTAAVLTAARNSIIYDEDGLTREPLGVSNDRLFVLPITRIDIYVEVTGLTVAAELASDAQDALETAIDEYLRALGPWIQGLDPFSNKKNVITAPVISSFVMNALEPFGGYVTGVRFGGELGVYVTSYVLAAGEKASLANITYVA